MSAAAARLVRRGAALAVLGLVLLSAGAAGHRPDCAASTVQPTRAERALWQDLGLAAAEQPESVEPCEGLIRPGARLVIGGTVLCTANWVVRDAAGALYLGTAGHCLPTLEARDIVVPGLGDIGDPAYTTGSGGVGRDFALVRIDPRLYAQVSPTLCHWGGPQGMAEPGDGAAGQQVVAHYGWGTAYGAIAETRARLGALPSFGWQQEHLTWFGATNPGDSGAPLLGHDGKALGLHTHASAGSAPWAGPGMKYGTRLDAALQRAGEALGPLDLVDSPVAADVAFGALRTV